MTLLFSLLSVAALGHDLEVSLVKEACPGLWAAESIDAAAESATVVIRDVLSATAVSGARVTGWIGRIDVDRRLITLFTSNRGRLPVSNVQGA